LFHRLEQLSTKFVAFIYLLRNCKTQMIRAVLKLLFPKKEKKILQKFLLYL
jgi:hypothetical protein